MIEWRIFKTCFNLQTLREIFFYVFIFWVLGMLKALAIPLVAAVKRSAGEQAAWNFVNQKMVKVINKFIISKYIKDFIHKRKETVEHNSS